MYASIWDHIWFDYWEWLLDLFSVIHFVLLTLEEERSWHTGVVRKHTHAYTHTHTHTHTSCVCCCLYVSCACVAAAEEFKKYCMLTSITLFSYRSLTLPLSLSSLSISIAIWSMPLYPALSLSFSLSLSLSLSLPLSASLSSPLTGDSFFFLSFSLFFPDLYCYLSPSLSLCPSLHLWMRAFICIKGLFSTVIFNRGTSYAYSQCFLPARTHT